MLRDLVATGELAAVGGTAFAVTPTLREAYASGNDDELGEVAMAEAARASLRLLAAERDVAGGPQQSADEDTALTAHRAPTYRRAVIAADVTRARLRPDLDDAVVRLAGSIDYQQIASVHVDLVDAEPQIAKAIEVVDAADLGDTDAEFVLGDAEDHQLAWYAAQELPFLLDLL
ncbi:hypothetical protein [Nocardia sp. CNY236]|uniref:DUF6912 family protein n=1 Tax=Nocardia sp. CNY236 TaxID=1169152 RepID=UPI0005658C25|nr:hypothetical protein [Nocardia sp. CNY236]